MASRYRRKGREPSATAFQSRNDQDESGIYLGEEIMYTSFHFPGVKCIFCFLFQKRCDEPNVLGHIRQKIPVLAWASEKRTQGLQLFRHGNIGEGGGLVSVRAISPVGEMVCGREKLALVGPRRALGEESLRLYSRKTPENSSDGADLASGAGVKDDDVIEERNNALQTTADLVGDLNGPPWSGVVAPCGMASHSKSWVGGQAVRGFFLFVRRNSVKIVQYTTVKSNNEKYLLPLQRESNTLLRARDGQLVEAAHLVELLAVDGILRTPPIFETTTRGGEGGERRSGMLYGGRRQ